MSMYFAEGREADAEREHIRSQPISVRRPSDFPEEPHWVIMTFESHDRLAYTAYLDRDTFERSVKEMTGRIFKAFHVDSFAKLNIEVSIK